MTKEKRISFDIAVMDPGYSNFKIAKIDTQSKEYLGAIQPSVISEVPEWQYKSLPDITYSACIEYKEKHYLVGTLALTYGLGIPSFIPGWLENLACPLFALAFCKEVKELYVLLSPSDWDIKNKIEASLVEAGFNNVKFAPQGIGIWLDVNSPRNATVIDIGFNTVDVFIVIDGKPIRELCFALKGCGLVSFLEKITKDDPSLLARRLEDGDEELAKKATEYYYPWLMQQLQVRTEWRKRPKNSLLVFGGGGAYFLPKEVKQKSRIPRHPEMANARGFAFFILERYQNGGRVSL